jgi:hypothetical protein
MHKRKDTKQNKNKNKTEKKKEHDEKIWICVREKGESQ